MPAVEKRNHWWATVGNFENQVAPWAVSPMKMQAEIDVGLRVLIFHIGSVKCFGLAKELIVVADFENLRLLKQAQMVPMVVSLVYD